MSYPGIDYSNGTANFDRKNGIHYGIIHSNRLADWFLSELGQDYGEPICYKCGAECEDSRKQKDYWCPSCKEYFWSDECFPKQPIREYFEDGDYSLQTDEQGVVWVFRSPYYTYAQFCSPCAPGAGHLENPCKEGVPTYCLGRDFFNKDHPCPYPICSIETGKKSNDY